MTAAQQNLCRSLRAERRVNIDDELYEREISQSRFERAMANGSAKKEPERVLCDCLEGIVNGRRVAVHRPVDCEYVRERSKLVEAAATVATVRVGDPAVGGKDRGYEWTRCFAAVVEEFAAPLLRQSNNGT